VPVQHSRDEEALLDIRSKMNRILDEFFSRPLALGSFLDDFAFSAGFTPRLDIAETEKEITISAELPGLEPEDIHLTLDHNNLTISGEKQAEKEEKGKRFYRMERSYGSFYRSIPLPDEVDENKIDASYKRGVLKIRLPKTVQSQRKSKRIPITFTR
jgi:HSP20 family protein